MTKNKLVNVIYKMFGEKVLVKGGEDGHRLHENNPLHQYQERFGFKTKSFNLTIGDTDSLISIIDGHVPFK